MRFSNKMTKKFVFILLVICTLTPVNSHYVLELTEDTFNDALKEYNSILIDFYATWCGHCQRFAPIYESASISLHDSNSVTVLARIDAYTYHSIKVMWKISGYPTLNYYFNGALVEEYPSKRSVHAIVEYINSKEKELL